MSSEKKGHSSKIIRFISEDAKEHLGFVTADEKLAEEIEGNDIFGALKTTGKTLKIVTVLPPTQPAAIFCIGLNYKPHAKEARMEIPKNPVVFMKNPAAATGPFSDIVIPACCKNRPQVDYEAELAVVIGKRCKNVSEKEALSYVLGYCVANDVSERAWQLDRELSGSQWIRGKSFDTFCPLGPHLALASAIDPSNLRLTTHLNDTKMQDGNTNQMIFSVPYLISFLTQDTTLLPGTVILTGTPDGVGFARNPQVWMKNGDKISITIENIGTITSRVRDA
jgi:2-keto-4-pentenoate hydratase/2-oxohepta-3-ene-1,7-dioic acid hydratase in catechol pathway